ncbi:MAG: hypothetical protein ACO1OB_06470 [Archangium sp.]
MPELKGWVALLLALVATLAAHEPSLSHGFVWDDHPLIERNDEAHVLQAPQAYLVRRFWSDSHGLEARDFYRPLISFSFSVDWVRGDGAPFAFHLTNVLLQLGCVALLFVWLRQRGASAVVAALMAAAWGTFPRLSESVAWISGRTDVFAAFFGLAALTSWPKRRALAAVAVLLSLLSKEVGVAFALALIIQTLWERRSLRPAWPVLVALGVYVLLRLGSPTKPLETVQLGAMRAVTVLEALGTYAAMLVTPWFPRTQIGLLTLPDWKFVALGAVVLLASLVALWKFRARSSAPAVLVLVGLGLVMHVLPLAVNVVAADRFLTVPLLGVAALVAPLIRRPPVVVVLVALVISFVFATRVREADWVDDLHLWHRELMVADGWNSYPRGAFADALADQHYDAEARTMYLASFEVQRALAEKQGLQPHYDEAGRLNLALATDKLGMSAEADALLADLLQQREQWPRLTFALILRALRNGRIDVARQELAKLHGEDRARGEALINDVEARLAALQKLDGVEALEARLELGRVLDDRPRMVGTAEVLVKDADEPSAVRGLNVMAVFAAPERAQQSLDAFRSRFPNVDVSPAAELITTRTEEVKWVREVPELRR